jgi:hypothetical protein
MIRANLFVKESNVSYQKDECEYAVAVELIDCGYFKKVVGTVGGREYISFSNQISSKWGCSGSTCLSTGDYRLAKATIKCYTECLEAVERIKEAEKIVETCFHCGN